MVLWSTQTIMCLEWHSYSFRGIMWTAQAFVPSKSGYLTFPSTNHILQASWVFGTGQFLSSLPNCAHILQPLNALLAVKTEPSKILPWNVEATQAFTNIKDVLANATLLSHPKSSQVWGSDLHHDWCLRYGCGSDTPLYTVHGALLHISKKKLKPAVLKYGIFDWQYICPSKISVILWRDEFFMCALTINLWPTLSPHVPIITAQGKLGIWIISRSSLQTLGTSKVLRMQQQMHCHGSRPIHFPHQHRWSALRQWPRLNVVIQNLLNF